MALEAQWLIKELGLSKSKLTLEIVPRPGLGKEMKVNGVTGRKGNLVGFAIDTKLNAPQLFATVAHEMIHVKQLAKGQLRYEMDGKKEKAFWMGRDLSHLPYFERPWEIEAFGKQEILSRQFDAALQEMAKEVEQNDKRKRKVRSLQG